MNLARGAELYEKACATCHGDKGEGKAEKFYPLVAGQHYKYLLREERFIRDGLRRERVLDQLFSTFCIGK